MDSEFLRLRDRLVNANQSLLKISDEYKARAEAMDGLDAIDYWKHYDRVQAKAEGVRLALAYLEEELRRFYD